MLDDVSWILELYNFSVHNIPAKNFNSGLMNDKFVVIMKIKKKIKGAVMQIEKVPINDRLRVSKVSENFSFQLYIILQYFTREICSFLKK